MTAKAKFDFSMQIGPLSEQERLFFYESLAHELTVATRYIWSNDSLSDVLKVTQMKWLNEIQHRVTAKISCLHRKTHDWSEEEFGLMVDGYISEHPPIGPLVQQALWRSHGFVSGSAALA
jgi:hypothetical protein